MKRSAPALRVIAGDLDQAFTVNGITMRLSPLERRLPSAVEALVVEQDTALLLDDSQPLRLELETSLTPSEILLAEEDIDYAMGTVIRKTGSPIRLLTVIHDLNQDPSWSEAGIEHALRTLFVLLPQLGIGSLALPALAHRHGGWPVAQFLTLLCDYLAQNPLPWRGELWLLLPRDSLQSSLARMHRLCDIHQP